MLTFHISLVVINASLTPIYASDKSTNNCNFCKIGIAAVQPLCTPSTEGAQEGHMCRCKFTILLVHLRIRKKNQIESVTMKENTLKKVLQPYDFFQVCGDGFILQINAVVQPGPKRDKAAADLQKLIEDSEIAIEFKVKLCWFLFLLGMINMAEEKKKAVLSIKDDKCFDLGRTLQGHGER